MKTLLKIIKDFPWFLWSGWGSVAAILLFIAVWDVAAQNFSPLVLPSPKDTFSALMQLLQDDAGLEQIKLTIHRAIIGFMIAFAGGAVLGLLAGNFVTASIFSRPIVTILVGMPPIAWIVLAMIWFGMGSSSVVFTVVVASFPIVFVSALQGAKTLEGSLSDVAKSFGLSFWQKSLHLYLPHLFSHLFPGFVSALGMSWKIVIMAELLGANDGVGAALKIARSQLETDVVLALVTVMIAFLLLFEYIVLEPVKREVESWRD